MVVTQAINQILRYSERKRRVNLLLENSTLKPPTNSDSPSIKSKGVRLSSANIIVIQMGGRIKKIILKKDKL